jgi:hypothetical protein
MHYKLKLKEDTEAERMNKLKRNHETVQLQPDYDQRSEEHKFDDGDEYDYYNGQNNNRY